MPPTRPRRKQAPVSRRSKAERRARRAVTAKAAPQRGPRHIVGIGASTGSLAALEAFLGAIPANSGLAFVAIVHPDPGHERLMPERLSSVRGLTVVAARDRQPLEPNRAYVIPPDRRPTIEQGVLRVRGARGRRSPSGAIDNFLRSLAASEGDRAVAVVLSGTGTEGTLGARAVKAGGGLVMAQAPETAAQRGMPASVIAEGIVDVVAAPDRMPEALVSYYRRRREGVGVTSFFRDPAAFDELSKKVLAPLVLRHDQDAPLRIWVPACSTGEEAYSIAIALAEQVGAAQVPRGVQIFATDVDERAVDIARLGAYPESIALDVLPQRLQRFFTQQGHRFTIAKSIRESVTFAVHDLTSDPPFSRIDLVSCRNLLIHLEPEMQQKLLSTFHHALNPGGYLFLGSAEGVGPLDELFVPVSKGTRIFRQLPTGMRQPLEFPSMNEESSANEAQATSKEELQPMNAELSALNARLQESVRELTTLNDDLGNLLAGTDIATVFLTPDLRIKRFTTAASHVLNLQPSDVGRPWSHVTSTLVDIDLLHDARTVLETSVPVEREVAAWDGREFILRVLPYRSTASVAVQGIVLTLVDTTRLKQAERDERAAREQVAADLRRMTRLHELSIAGAGSSDVKAMLERAIRAAVDITGADFSDIQWCDDAGVLTMAAQVGFGGPFLDYFGRVDRETASTAGVAMTTRRRVVVENVTSSAIFAGTPALAVVDAAGVRAAQSTPLFGRSGEFLGVLSTYYRDRHHFGEDELRWLDLLARLTADIIEQHRVSERLAQTHRELEMRVADRTRWLSLMHDVVCEINGAPTWDEALSRVLRRVCDAEDWQIGFVYAPTAGNPDGLAPVVSCFRDERLRPFEELTRQLTYARGDYLPGRVFMERTAIWALDSEALLKMLPRRSAAASAAGLRAGAGFPIAVRDEVIAVLELFSRNTHTFDEQLSSLMEDVAAQIALVVERERTTERMADLAWREQQKLLHTLHDSLGQSLTGLGMLSAGLRQRLRGSDAEASDTAAEIVRQTQEALEQVRQLARSLFPTEVDAESLMTALHALATATQSLHKLEVRVKGAAPRTLRDGKVATELYRIAQEAVTNSVKHARAKTITIGLEGASGLMRLWVADDGIGIRGRESTTGAGLRIMKHRAASIGAMLAVEPGAAGGTVVTCTLQPPPASHKVTE